jgi:GNAT superfamily N-acetyltransferase
MVDVRPAEPADVAAIRDLFRACYGIEYPHPEFYELDALTRLVYSDNQLLLVAADTETKEVLGTASVILETGALSDLVGEFGRLAVHPRARHRKIGSSLMSERLRRVRDRLHVGLVDARVAHPFSMRISEAHGFAPVGFMPLKMQLHERESLCVLAQCFGDAKALRRNHPRVIPEAYPLAQLALEHCGIPCDVIVDETAAAYPPADELELRELTSDGYSTLLRIERGRIRHREIFGPLRLHYGLFKLLAQRSHYLLALDRQRIVGAVGWTMDPIERTIRIFEVIALDGPTARLLLAGLDSVYRDEGRVSFVEVDVNAHAPQMQRTLLELGFLPAAYVPAMVFSDVERLDIVKMVRLLAPPDFPPLELSPRARAVADVVLEPFVRQRVLPQLERAVGELPLFRGLQIDQVRRLAAICRVVRFEAGEMILQEGCCDHTLFILLDGRVDVRRSGMGSPGSPVAVIGKGECLGELSLLTGAPHTATAVAMTACEAAAIEHDDLSRLMRVRPDIGVAVYRNLAVGLGAKLTRTPALQARAPRWIVPHE